MSPAVRRFITFNLVGMLGAIVHLGMLSGLSRALALHASLAAVLAVEAALLHNFVWHERWTWIGRGSGATRVGRLLRFHGTNGLVSLVGNAVLLPAFVNLGLPVEVGGIAAIVVCSVVNFQLADRVVFTSTLAALALGLSGARADAGPPAEALEGWRVYVAATQARLAADTVNRRSALTEGRRRAVLAGHIDVEALETLDGRGRAIEISSGLVHHWRGWVFVPGIELDALLARIREPAVHRAQPDVLDARILRAGDDELDLFLRITRSQFVTATYDTEHRVRYARLDPMHATATSISTRIAEVGRDGSDRGFLWRLNAYWRYEAINGGVLVECESLSLSRTVPLVLRPVAGPIVRSFARESMVRTLTALRDALRRDSAPARAPAREIPPARMSR